MSQILSMVGPRHWYFSYKNDQTTSNIAIGETKYIPSVSPDIQYKLTVHPNSLHGVRDTLLHDILLKYNLFESQTHNASNKDI